MFPSLAPKQAPRHKDPELTADQKKWRCIYPMYLNKSRSLRDGRRAAAANCVTSPTCDEISKALTSLGMEYVWEHNKVHTADQLTPGRLKVRLEASSDPKCKLEFPIPKRRLLIEIGKILVEKRSRVVAVAAEERQARAVAAKKAAAKKTHTKKKKATKRRQKSKWKKKRR